jgi:hypothetical protein
VAKLRQCKVCFKLYDPTVGWQCESHVHQGQGPDGKSTKTQGRDHDREKK